MKIPGLIFLTLITSFLISCSTDNNAEKRKDKEWSIYVSPVKQLLFSDDHTSEGFLAPLKNGKILLLFRLDPGLEGNHVGTNGYIAKISYDPGQDKWGTVETVYNSHQYDDRNIHGGVTKDGRIVAFFRKYDGSKTVGRYFIYSDDNGRTWSEPQPNNFMSDPETLKLSGNMSTGQMFYDPDIEKYIMLGFLYSWDRDTGYLSTRRYTAMSRDGSSWDEYSYVTEDKDHKLITEIAGAWCGDNRIIALQCIYKPHGHALVQVESYDNGKTWIKPDSTDMPPKHHWGSAPQLIYNRTCDLLIALTNDRYTRPDSENSLFIYTARPGEVFNNPQNWKLQHELPRPLATLKFEGDRPLNENFYGYPTTAPINEQEYLVVFTERSKMHGTEQADLYYFRLIIK
jgi:hypothetical protein